MNKLLFSYYKMTNLSLDQVKGYLDLVYSGQFRFMHERQIYPKEKLESLS